MATGGLINHWFYNSKMDFNTQLIKLTLVLSTVLIVVIVIYAFNKLPLNKFAKETISIIIIILSAAWIVDEFVVPEFISDLIKNIFP